MASIQPEFRNSGLLNNCGFGAALPVILSAFEQYAKDEEELAFTLDKAHQEHIGAYQTLKDTIAAYYGLDKESFNFSQAVRLFTSLQNNYAQQAIMGLALRAFMETQEATEEMTTLDENGRYPTLNASQLYQYVYSPLGIDLFSFPHQQQPEFFTHNETTPINAINLHINDGHIEPKPQLQLNTLRNDRNQLSQTCPEIEQAIVMMTSGAESKVKSEQGIFMIKETIQTQYAKLESLKIATPAIIPESIVEKEPVQKFAEFKSELAKRYQNHGFFGKTGITKETINTVQAKADESDEAFAQRLQAAEYELYRPCL